MKNGNFDKQFIGQARLVRLLLWKIGDSTDINACLEVAKSKNMVTKEDEAFLIDCMNAEEASRNGGSIGLEADEGVINHLRRCADKLNRADSA